MPLIQKFLLELPCYAHVDENQAQGVTVPNNTFQRSLYYAKGAINSWPPPYQLTAGGTVIRRSSG